MTPSLNLTPISALYLFAVYLYNIMQWVRLVWRQRAMA